MKKLPNEIIIGAIAIITIILFVLLFNYLKGRNVLKKSIVYYAVYENIGGLNVSSPVEINGFKTGVVREIDFINDGTGRLIVSINMDKAYKMPQGTIAEISNVNILAGMKIQMILGNKTGWYTNGDTIPGRLAESSLQKLDNEFDPLINKVDLIISELDTLLKGMNTIITPDLQKNISKSSYSFKNISKDLENMLKSSGSNTSELIANLNNFSKMLANNNAAIDSTITNISIISRELAASELNESVKSLKTSIDETAIMLKKLNKGEGSAGLFLNDDTLYFNFVKSLEQLNLVLEDLRNDPGKYVSFSVFGGKRKSKD